MEKTSWANVAQAHVELFSRKKIELLSFHFHDTEPALQSNIIDEVKRLLSGSERFRRRAFRAGRRHQLLTPITDTEVSVTIDLNRKIPELFLSSTIDGSMLLGVGIQELFDDIIGVPLHKLLYTAYASHGSVQDAVIAQIKEAMVKLHSKD